MSQCMQVHNLFFLSFQKVLCDFDYCLHYLTLGRNIYVINLHKGVWQNPITVGLSSV